MNKGPSVTIDLMLVIVVLWLVTRGQGQSWIQTLFQYHPINLNLNPLHDLSIATPFGPFRPFDGGGSSGGGGNTGAIASVSSHGPGTGTATYTVNLAGGGQMAVNASSPSAALENVIAEGGVPA